MTGPSATFGYRDVDASEKAGLVREIDEQSALVDFNHPLAGKSIRFVVEVIGVS